MESTQDSIKSQKAIIDRISRLMEARGVNRAELARLTKRSQSQITIWLNRKLTRKGIVEIAKALGTTADEILGTPDNHATLATSTAADAKTRALEEELLAARKKLLDCELNNVELRKELLSMGRRPSV